jgi:hypothetical protein
VCSRSAMLQLASRAPPFRGDLRIHDVVTVKGAAS